MSLRALATYSGLSKRTLRTPTWIESQESAGAIRPSTSSHGRRARSSWTLPRTLDLLFSRNRSNVAVSRAMCLACIVASPRLLESRARTIEQMRLINALCRFAEMAGEQ